MWKNKKKIILICVVIIVLIALIAVGIMGIVTSQSLNIRFFTDINSFTKLNEFAVSELELTDDKYLENNKIVYSYTKEILYNGERYAVYAYVFQNESSAMEYFEKCTGKKADLKWNFSSSSNYISRSEYVAYYENCLYRIEGGGYRAFINAVNFINESFPIEYEDLYSHSEQSDEIDLP